MWIVFILCIKLWDYKRKNIFFTWPALWYHADQTRLGRWVHWRGWLLAISFWPSTESCCCLSWRKKNTPIFCLVCFLLLGLSDKSLFPLARVVVPVPTTNTTTSFSLFGHLSRDFLILSCRCGGGESHVYFRFLRMYTVHSLLQACIHAYIHKQFTWLTKSCTFTIFGYLFNLMEYSMFFFHFSFNFRCRRVHFCKRYKFIFSFILEVVGKLWWLVTTNLPAINFSWCVGHALCWRKWATTDVIKKRVIK